MARGKNKGQRPKGTGSLYRRTANGNWIERWYDHTGKRQEASTYTTDRAAAERILNVGLLKRLADYLGVEIIIQPQRRKMK